MQWFGVRTLDIVATHEMGYGARSEEILHALLRTLGRSEGAEGAL